MFTHVPTFEIPNFFSIAVTSCTSSPVCGSSSISFLEKGTLMAVDNLLDTGEIVIRFKRQSDSGGVNALYR